MSKSTAINNHNIVSAAAAADIIRASVQALFNDTSLAHALPPIMLRGAPGVGKSTIVKSIAKELGVEFRDIRLAEMERCDVGGIPSVENGVTKWNVPNIWPTDPKSKGIILLDEITAAPADVQVAAYQICLDRTIANANYRLPDGWFIVAAGNRVEDRAVAKVMSSALANRFMHFELEADAEDWRNYAVKNELHPAVTGFIGFKPACLFKFDPTSSDRGWASPRSWEKLSNIIPHYAKLGEEILRSAVYSLIGNAVGVEFMEYYKINKKFDNVLEIMTNPKAEFECPEKADERYAVASAVAYLLWNAKDEADQKARIDGMFRIAMKMPSSFATMIAQGAMLGSKKVTAVQAAAMIVKNENFKEFAKKFGKSFAKKQYQL